MFVTISANMNVSSIKNKEALRFIKVFLAYRAVNRKFFESVEEKDFDYRMVDNEKRRSDSPRESLVHLIEVESSYLLSAKDGQGNQWKRAINQDLKTKSKVYLLNLLSRKDEELVSFLSNEENLKKSVQVKWSENPIPVLSYLWAMNDHEILHNGWNLALMDFLNIPRFDELKKIWG